MLPRLRETFLSGVRSIAGRFADSEEPELSTGPSEEELAERRTQFIQARQNELALITAERQRKALPPTNSPELADRYLSEMAIAAVQLEQHGGERALRQHHVGAARAAFIIATRLQFLADDLGQDENLLAQTAMDVRGTVQAVGAIAANEIIALCGGDKAVADMILGGATPASIVRMGFHTLVEEDIAREREAMAAQGQASVSSLLVFSPLPKKSTR